MKFNPIGRVCFVLIMGLMALASWNVSRPWAALSSSESEKNSWFIDMAKYAQSAHGTLSCETCHDDMKRNGKAHPDLSDLQILLSDSVQTYDYSRCKVCHQQAYSRYMKGEHAKALQKQKKGGLSKLNKSDAKRAPTCGDCHDIHYEKPHRTRVEIGRKMTETCGVCHMPQKETYLMDFHGKKAVNLRLEAAAYCSDCHGAHQCISLKDKEKALLICQRCHPMAGGRFAEYVVHPTVKGVAPDDLELKASRVAVIKAVTTIMLIIVIVVVAFFYGHSFLWLLRELHERLRKH